MKPIFWLKFATGNHLSMRTACSILNVLVWLAVWLQCPVSAIPYVVYDGHAWATLDAADPQASGYSGCQNYWLALPEGWEVAPASTAVRTNVIGAYGWGTDLLVAANGEAYSTATAVRHGWSPGARYRSGWLEQNSNEYKTRCWGRILIYQARWSQEKGWVQRLLPSQHQVWPCQPFQPCLPVIALPDDWQSCDFLPLYQCEHFLFMCLLLLLSHKCLFAFLHLIFNNIIFQRTNFFCLWFVIVLFQWAWITAEFLIETSIKSHYWFIHASQTSTSTTTSATRTATTATRTTRTATSTTTLTENPERTRWKPIGFPSWPLQLVLVTTVGTNTHFQANMLRDLHIFCTLCQGTWPSRMIPCVVGVGWLSIARGCILPVLWA